MEPVKSKINKNEVNMIQLIKKLQDYKKSYNTKCLYRFCLKVSKIENENLNVGKQLSKFHIYKKIHNVLVHKKYKC